MLAKRKKLPDSAPGRETKPAGATPGKVPSNRIVLRAMAPAINGRTSQEVSEEELRLIIKKRRTKAIREFATEWGDDVARQRTRDLLEIGLFKEAKEKGQRLVEKFGFIRERDYTGSENDKSEGQVHTTHPIQVIQHGILAQRSKLWPWPKPAKLQTKDQLLLLSNVMHLLEVSCYEYSKLHVPQQLAKREWTCSEELDVGIWGVDMDRIQIFYGKDEKDAEINKTRRSFLLNLPMIKEAVVYRTRLELDTLDWWLCHASMMLEMMGDTDGQSTISKIRRVTRCISNVLVYNKEMIFSRYEQTLLSKVRGIGGVLTDKEKAIVNAVKKEYVEAEKAAGKALVEALTAQGLQLGRLGISFSDPSRSSSTLAENAEKDVGGSHKEANGVQEGDTTDAQPSQSPAGARADEEMVDSLQQEVQVPHDEQGVDEGGEKQIEQEENDVIHEVEEHSGLQDGSEMIGMLTANPRKTRARREKKLAVRSNAKSQLVK